MGKFIVQRISEEDYTVLQLSEGENLAWCLCLNHLLKFLWNFVGYILVIMWQAPSLFFVCFILSCVVHPVILSVPGWCCLNKLCPVVVRGCTVLGQGWKRRCADSYQCGTDKLWKEDERGFLRWPTNKKLAPLGCKKLCDMKSCWSSLGASDQGSRDRHLSPFTSCYTQGIVFLLFEAS